jgi:hypothetical protein
VRRPFQEVGTLMDQAQRHDVTPQPCQEQSPRSRRTEAPRLSRHRSAFLQVAGSEFIRLVGSEATCTRPIRSPSASSRSGFSSLK